jgi:arginase family enzyme
MERTQKSPEKNNLFFMELKLIAVPSSQGSLEKNLGCEKFPELIFAEFPESEKTKIQIIPTDIEATDKIIFEEAKKIFQEQKFFPFFIGGDHSITYSEFKAFSRQYESPSLIVFDAHADCAQFFKPVSHEDMNKVLVEEGILKKENLLLVGVRKIYEIEEKWLKEKNIELISAQEIRNNLDSAKSKLKKFISSNKRKNFFVSIDADVFDPKAMPATGYLEENGLNEKEFFSLIEIILETNKVKGMDLAEINPLKDEKGKALNLGKNITLFVKEKVK